MNHRGIGGGDIESASELKRAIEQIRQKCQPEELPPDEPETEEPSRERRGSSRS
jgi:hypothetical protein